MLNQVKHIIAVALLIFSANLLAAQDSTIEIPADSSLTVKKGFAWGGTPILAYDSDLGLRYGAVINLFDYGNGDHFPKYLQYAKIKAFNTTKGTSSISLLVETDKLFKNTKLISEFSYIKDIALNFYGFNGKQTNFHQPYINPDNDNYINKFYYNHQRRWIRARLDIQKQIAESNFRLLLGYTYNTILIENIDPDVLDVPDGSLNEANEDETLYQSYSKWNVLDETEEKGGTINHIKAGLIYDSRNNPINCHKGTWMETFLVYSPKIKSNPSFAKHIFTFRQYLQIHKLKSTLFYRISSQQKLWGKTPFYYLPIYFNSQYNQDGLGGAFTLRGISRNRIASDGFILGNIEIRKKILSFRLLKLDFDIELSAFADASLITQDYEADYSNIPEADKSILINNDYSKAYITYGPGLYIIYNVNNIISVNLGFSNDDQLGVSGLYVGSAFLF